MRFRRPTFSMCLKFLTTRGKAPNSKVRLSQLLNAISIHRPFIGASPHV